MVACSAAHMLACRTHLPEVGGFKVSGDPVLVAFIPGGSFAEGDLGLHAKGSALRQAVLKRKGGQLQIERLRRRGDPGLHTRGSPVSVFRICK